MAAPESYEVSAGGLSIRSAAGSSRVRVAWIADGGLEVTTLSGAARVANRTGLVLASIPAGRRMNFAMQAAAGVVTRTGCLLSKDGRFLMQDQNTQEIVEVRGNNLASNVGNRVSATGTASNLRPALAIATSILNATTIMLQQTGGCLSVAAALDAQTEPTNAPATAAVARREPARRGARERFAGRRSENRDVHRSQGGHRRGCSRWWSRRCHRLSRRQDPSKPQSVNPGLRRCRSIIVCVPSH